MTWEEFQAGFKNIRGVAVMEIKNPNCDGAKCTKAAGEVRLVPIGGRGNAILCRACYVHEIKFRRDMNRDRPALYKYELPRWDSLKIYKGV